MTAQFDLGALGWWILPLGGASRIGKSTIAMGLGQRLAFECSSVAIPDSALTPAFDVLRGLGGLRSLIEVGASPSPTIEVVCEDHTAQNSLAIITGDAIFPTVFDRPQIRYLAAGSWLDAVFLDALEEQIIRTNMQARKRGQMDPTQALQRWRYGRRLCHAATGRSVRTMPARPWQTLEDRGLAYAQSPRIPHSSGGRP